MMTAKQALMRAVDSGKPVYDNTGHKHYIVFAYGHFPVLKTTNPRQMPFCIYAAPYRFEDMTND